MAVLGASRALQGEYEQAAAIFDRILKGIGPPDKLKDPSLYSRALVGRAEALAALERYDEARRLIDQALAWDRSNDGARSPSVARDLEAMGLTQQMAGDLGGSRRSFEQALAIRASRAGTIAPEGFRRPQPAGSSRVPAEGPAKRGTVLAQIAGAGRARLGTLTPGPRCNVEQSRASDDRAAQISRSTAPADAQREYLPGATRRHARRSRFHLFQLGARTPWSWRRRRGRNIF